MKKSFLESCEVVDDFSSLVTALEVIDWFGGTCIIIGAGGLAVDDSCSLEEEGRNHCKEVNKTAEAGTIIVRILDQSPEMIP